MSLEETILAIRREYSKDEKFKLFLQQLNNVENELHLERKRVTEQLKQIQQLQEYIKQLSLELEEATESLEGFSKSNPDGNKFVKRKTFDKAKEVQKMWETRFWEVNNELIVLKEQIKNK